MDERYVKRILTSDGPKQIDYNALANLPKSIQTIATISKKEAWNVEDKYYTQSIIIEGVTDKSVVEISLTSDADVDQVLAYQALNLQDGGQSADTITLRAFGTLNNIEIPISVIVRKDLE